jgi:anti-sigma regulatory factor (Ser/Thr protein kinase)
MTADTKREQDRHITSVRLTDRNGGDGMPGEDNPEWPLCNEAGLVCLPSAAYWARRYIKDTLIGWDLTGLIDIAELLVSELTTNAYQAAVADKDPSLYAALTRLPCLRIRLWSDRTRLVIEIWDPSSQPPIPKNAGIDDEGGRGLSLVGSLAKQWSYYFPSQGGKWVWCEITAEVAA